ncbi:hypothetical protein [Kitasatospora sp. NBC_00315]|uniref:hypothetical protein n=1 Tax=Kitasatospora sp. NBC_00315 TaxID=2975963 RepID=UPI0032456205
MNRRVAVALAAVLLAAASLTSCGGPLQAGAAAVVGGERISLADVQARATGLRAAAAAEPGGTGELAQRAVAELILDALVARALADRGLSVAAGDVADARAQDGVGAGASGPAGADAVRLDRLLALRGVPATGADGYYRQQAGIRLLAAAQGLDAGTGTGDAAVRRALAEAATGLGVRVNPRYGRWDAQRAALVPAGAPEGSTAAP